MYDVLLWGQLHNQLLLIMELTNIQRRVYHRLSELKTPQSVAMLSGYFFLSRSAVYTALIDLEEKNLVEHIGYGLGWRIVL